MGMELLEELYNKLRFWVLIGGSAAWLGFALDYKYENRNEPWKTVLTTGAINQMVKYGKLLREDYVDPLINFYRRLLRRE